MALQIALAAGLWVAGMNKDAGTHQSTALFAAMEQKGGVDKVSIQDGMDGTLLVLKRASGEWLMPEHERLRAVSKQVDDLIDAVASMKTGWAITEDSDSWERFEVIEEKYRKRIRLYDGEELLADLFVGTSPSFRYVNVRRADDDKVYSIEFEAQGYGSNADDWLDKKLLQTPKVVAIKGADYEIEEKNGEWLLVGGGDDELDGTKARTLASKLQDLRIIGIAQGSGADEEEEEEGAEEENEDALPKQGKLEVRDAALKNHQFYFSRYEEQYRVQRSDYNKAFLISKSDYEALIGQQRTDLLVAAEEMDDGGAASDGNSTQVIEIPLQVNPE
ncbi:MAG: DUF4340 domain-containing protein [Candidatus Eutrophobiaceae bacterium]